MALVRGRVKRYRLVTPGGRSVELDHAPRVTELESMASIIDAVLDGIASELEWDPATRRFRRVMP